MKREKFWWIAPDLLTLSRPLFGVAISLLGVFGDRTTLPIATFLLLAGWTTDIVDGRLARWAEQKYQRRESWIGRNEIRADSLMLIGVFIYLGCIQAIPLWLSISYASILFILAVDLHSTYHQNMFFEAPAAIATFLLLIILTGRPTLGYVATWGFLVLIYDWKRAMQLGGRLRSVLEASWQKFSQQPFVCKFWISAFIVVAVAGSIALGFSHLVAVKVIGGIVIGLLVLLAYLICH